MINFKLIKNFKLANALILSTGIMSCSTNSINTTSLTSNQIIQDKNTNKSINLKSNNNFKFGVKFASNFNPEAYFLAWGDIRQSIRNRIIPDVIHHYAHAQTFEPQRFTDSNYLQVKSRIENKEWSEEAYLIANPDVKYAIDIGTAQSGYSHWYNYAINSEPSRTAKTTYIDAKAATDLGFSEKAYRLAYPDIDNAIKNGFLANAYAHWNTYAKNNETTRLSDPQYIKIKTALDYGFDEKAYRLAYPDIDNDIKAGRLPSALFHYINYGINENRLESPVYYDAKLYLLNLFDEKAYRLAYLDIDNDVKSGRLPSALFHYINYGINENRLETPEYMGAKLALSLDFNETRYRLAFPDVAASINAGRIVSGFRHFYLYGKNEGRLTLQAYLDTKNKVIIGGIRE